MKDRKKYAFTGEGSTLMRLCSELMSGLSLLLLSRCLWSNPSWLNYIITKTFYLTRQRHDLVLIWIKEICFVLAYIFKSAHHGRGWCDLKWLKTDFSFSSTYIVHHFINLLFFHITMEIMNQLTWFWLSSLTAGPWQRYALYWVPF